MKFIATIAIAAGLASCQHNYVELEAGNYDFKSNPYTLPADEKSFASPRQLVFYLDELERQGDSRVNDRATAIVDNSITNTWSILPAAPKNKKAAKGRKGRKSKTKTKTKASDPVSRPPIVATYDKYPKFNSPMAVTLWKMMRRSDSFTQSDISNAIELCIVAYDYLSKEYEEILGHNYSEAKRRDCLVDLDNGKGSEIMNFSNTFSRRLNKMPDISEANLSRLQMMNEKKEYSRQLLNRVVEP